VVHVGMHSFVFTKDAAPLTSWVTTSHIAASIQLIEVKHTIIRYGK